MDQRNARAAYATLLSPGLGRTDDRVGLITVERAGVFPRERPPTPPSLTTKTHPLTPWEPPQHVHRRPRHRRHRSNLFTGIQIAFSQPFRVDDVLVVDNRWGRVGEITLSYVVLRLWDRRTPILPISQFTKRPLETWTRSSSALTGTVEMDLDFTAPIEPIRARLGQLLAQHPRWDQRSGALQVTGAGPQRLHVRALVTARMPRLSHDLRCDIREQLLTWLAREHPGALPQVRLTEPRRAADLMPSWWPRRADGQPREHPARCRGHAGHDRSGGAGDQDSDDG